MDTSDSEAPETELDVLRRGTSLLRERLPAGWSLDMSPPGRSEPADARIEVAGPDGRSATFVAEAKRVVEGRDVSRLREQLEARARQFSPGQGLVLARYLSSPVRSKLADAGLSYIDATGNMRIEIPSPGLFIADRGADRDPWRGPGRPRGTLKGAPAARIVRALTDLVGRWTARDLSAAAKVSTGATYRVIEFLEREGLVTRDGSAIVVPDWEALLRRWSADYGFLRDSSVTRWIAPRGITDLVANAAAQKLRSRYAVTGTLAAAEWAAYAPARAAMIYVEDASEAAEAWDLRPTDTGVNVLLAEPAIDVVFERTRTTTTDLEIAAPTQVVVDLMTGPGRNPSEAEELLEWMKRNERSWR